MNVVSLVRDDIRLRYRQASLLRSQETNVSFTEVDSIHHRTEGVLGDLDTSFLPESEIIDDNKFIISEGTACI